MSVRGLASMELSRISTSSGPEPVRRTTPMPPAAAPGAIL
jgi:hypothetical protein